MCLTLSYLYLWKVLRQIHHRLDGQVNKKNEKGADREGINPGVASAVLHNTLQTKGQLPDRCQLWVPV